MTQKATGDKNQKERLAADPNGFITAAIADFVRTSPANRLETFGDAAIFTEPLVGFADGLDPLFDEYKKVIHEEHLHPREVLMKHLRETLKSDASEPAHVSVVSFVLPINRETLRTNAEEKEGPSLRWNHTRWKGQEFIGELTRHLVTVLENLEVQVVAPDLSPFFRIIRTRETMVSTWSQRHMAYAAGLGTFSLTDGFITAKGQAMRCGSVVTNLKLNISPRPYAHYRANCLFYATGKCGVCIRRCPGDALSERGHDKSKCYDILFKQQKPWIEGAHGPGYIGQYAGCGLCQTGVPCEHRIPVRPEGQEKAG